jgi:hypothetical protein
MFGNIGLIRDSRDLKRQMHREHMKKVTQQPSIPHPLDRMGNVTSCAPVFSANNYKPAPITESH